MSMYGPAAIAAALQEMSAPADHGGGAGVAVRAWRIPMTVYVDELPRSGWGRWNGGAHMLGTDLDELHATARRIGLCRTWFQGDSSFAHYDLTSSKRALALAEGAVAIKAGEIPDAVLMRCADGTYESRARRQSRRPGPRPDETAALPGIYSRRTSATDEIPDGAVYVGRPGPFGNPFTVPLRLAGQAQRDAHTDAVAAYRNWIAQPEQAALRHRVRRELAGRPLVCWCRSPSDPQPLACHAEVLRDLANT